MIYASSKEKISIIGDGGWGTTLGVVLFKRDTTLLYGDYFPIT